MGKRKRNQHKPLFPRRYASDFINTGQRVDTVKIAASDFLNNRQRVRTTKGKRTDAEPVLENTFTRPIPKTLGLSVRNREMDIDPTLDETGILKLEAEEQNAKTSLVPPKEKPRSPYIPVGWIDPPRKLALYRRTEEKEKQEQLKNKPGRLFSMFRGGVREYNQLTLCEVNKFKVTLLFLGSECLLVQETEDTRWISQTYGSVAVAKATYLAKTVQWIIEESITTK